MTETQVMMEELSFTDEQGNTQVYGWRVRRVDTLYVDILRMLTNYRVVLTNVAAAQKYGMLGSYDGHGWCYSRAYGFARIVGHVMEWALDPADVQAPPGEWIRDTHTGRYRVPGIGQQ